MSSVMQRRAYRKAAWLCGIAVLLWLGELWTWAVWKLPSKVGGAVAATAGVLFFIGFMIALMHSDV